MHLLSQLKQKVKDLGLGNNMFVQSQVVERYHCTDEEILEFLNDGNLILSSSSVSFTHPNFIYDPTFNLVFFYDDLGFNYLKYHKQDCTKTGLLGTYYRKKHIDGNNRVGRDMVIDMARTVLEDDLKILSDESKTEFNYLLENNEFFGKWTQHTHITSYTDYMINSCNLMCESMDPSIGQQFEREYITEKTLKAILFSEENIFFILYCTDYNMKVLTDLGFWFLNTEFYTDQVNRSVFKSFKYLKQLKNELKDDQKVYEFLLKTYGDKLENNVRLYKKMYSHYDKSEEILARIKK